MAPKTVTLKTFLTTLILTVMIEIIAWISVRFPAFPSLEVTGLARLIQTVLIFWIVVRFDQGFTGIGLAKKDWFRGLKTGLLWSAGFGLAAALGFGLLYLFGYNALLWIRAPLPSGFERGLYFLVGGLIGPIWEEVFFRGVLYGYLRRWGILFALIITTAIFVLLHAVQGFPLTQIVGGIVFALAYEASGNLLVPITIHTLGNLAIFTLSL